MDRFDGSLAGVCFVLECHGHLLTLVWMYCNFYCVNFLLINCAGFNLAKQMLLD